MEAGIAHYSTLVQELETEHRALLAAFGLLKKAAEAHDPVAFKKALASFKALLVPHVVKEAFKVYTYLRQQSKERGDTDVYERVTSYKKEMAGIGDAALRFIDTHSQTPDHDLDFVGINAALHDIGHLLGDRIRREENDLYPLYQSTL